MMTTNELNLLKSHLRKLTVGEVELKPEKETRYHLITRTLEYDGPSEIDKETYHQFRWRGEPCFQLGGYFCIEVNSRSMLFWQQDGYYFMRWLESDETGILLELAGIYNYEDL
jgi:hypothetical protein